MSLWKVDLAFPDIPCFDKFCPSSSLPFSGVVSKRRARLCKPFTDASSFLQHPSASPLIAKREFVTC